MSFEMHESLCGQNASKSSFYICRSIPSFLMAMLEKGSPQLQFSFSKTLGVDSHGLSKLSHLGPLRLNIGSVTGAAFSLALAAGFSCCVLYELQDQAHAQCSKQRWPLALRAGGDDSSSTHEQYRTSSLLFEQARL